MITIYPLYVSRSISQENVLLICKALELYTASNMYTDAGNSYTNIVKNVLKFVISAAVGSFISTVVSKAGGDVYSHAKGLLNPPKPKITSGNSIFESDLSLLESQIQHLSEGNTYGIPTRYDISAEPTVVQMGDKYVGIKVLPIYIEDDEKFFNLMKSDIGIESAEKYYKATTGHLQGIIPKIRGWFKSKPEIQSSLSTSEIAFMSSIKANNVYLCLNYNDFKEKIFDPDNKNFDILFKMNWKSTVLIDEVNQRAFFCMKEFKGICNVIPFQHLSASFGKYNVYKDMSDAKASSSAFFRISGGKALTKLMSESILQDKLNIYDSENTLHHRSNFNNGTNTGYCHLEEGVVDFFKTHLNPAEFIKAIKHAILAKDSDNLEHKLKTVKDVKVKDIKSELESDNPEFQKYHKYAYTVIKNSKPNLPDNMADAIATGIATRSVEKGGDIKANVKSELKSNVSLLMKFGHSSLIGVAQSLIWLWLTDWWLFPNTFRIAGILLIIGRQLYIMALELDDEVIYDQ